METPQRRHRKCVISSHSPEVGDDSFSAEAATTVPSWMHRQHVLCTGVRGSTESLQLFDLRGGGVRPVQQLQLLQGRGDGRVLERRVGSIELCRECERTFVDLCLLPLRFHHHRGLLNHVACM